MPARAWFPLLLICLLGLFTVINWPAFTAPTTLWLLFGHVQAPLGIVLLAIVAVVLAVVLLYVFYLQATVLRDTRRQQRELATQRLLAEQSEASRVHELRTAVDAAVQSMEQALQRSQAQLQQRMEQLATEVSTYIGELEDRLERRDGGGQPPPH